jgi:hypothetical protein
MTYTLTLEHLGSEFATVDYRAMQAVHDSLLADIRGASHYRIEARNGTDLRGQIRSSVLPDAPAVTEFSLDLFPVLIFPPVHFYALEGRLVLDHFLMSSSTRAYEDSVLILDSPIGVTVENNRMTLFEGDSRLVDRVCAQLERAAAITGGDPYQLNSWHTGINPYTFYADDPYADLERWGTAAFGSPRYTHIHAAGHDPGDISIQLFDASISLDDALYWKQGQFLFLDQPDLRMRFDTPPIPDSATQMSIGL